MKITSLPPEPPTTSDRPFGNRIDAVSPDQDFGDWHRRERALRAAENPEPEKPAALTTSHFEGG